MTFAGTLSQPQRSREVPLWDELELVKIGIPTDVLQQTIPSKLVRN